MQVEDLDGNVLRLGSEPKENQPTGEWLDMDGRRRRTVARNPTTSLVHGFARGQVAATPEQYAFAR